MIVVCGGIKGGGGKTTTCTNLAVMCALDGRDVLFIDGDSVDNQTGTDFFNIRLEHSEDKKLLALALSNVQISGKAMLSEVQKLSGKFDDLFIDVGGADSVTQRAAIAVADLLLVPVFPSSYDLWTLDKVSEIVEEVSVFNPKLKAACFLSRADSVGSRNAEAAELLQGYDNLLFWDTPLRNRNAFRDSAALGLAVVEYTPKDKKAIAEISALYQQFEAL